MDEWEERIREALRELGADKELVPGAKLKQQILRSSPDANALDEFLIQSARKFSEMLEGVEGIVIHKRGGTDMLVGFAGADWPITLAPRKPSAAAEQLRQDVYEALTRVGPTKYFYLPSSDRFIAGPVDQDGAVPLPLVTWPDLFAERKRFAEALADKDVSGKLLQALQQPVNPLGAYQALVMEAKLGAKWHAFKFGLLRARLEKWASENGVTMSPSWFGPAPSEQRHNSKAVLAQLAEYMTDDEIRQLPIPFRAVEALLSSVVRKSS